MSDQEWRDAALAWAGRQPHRLVISGEQQEADSGRTYLVIDPSVVRTVAVVPDASPQDVEATVSAADSACRTWSRHHPAERAAVVRSMADIAEQHVDEIAALDSVDTGVPFWMMRADVATGIARMRMFADWALRLTGETVPASNTHLHYTERIPFGVVARIVAYNHPAMFGISKIAAPLVAGNTVLLKPSQFTPLSMLRLAELWADIVPPGVLAVLTGASVETGATLVSDPRVRRIAFTGSPSTGRTIQHQAAESAVKTVSLELGGKNALIALPDADPDEVVDGVVKGMNFAFAGQSCGSTSRLLVPNEMADGMLEQLAERFRALTVGDPFAPNSQVSPLISAEHHERVHGSVRSALSTSARLITGGTRPGSMQRGHFFAPTLLHDKDPGSAIATQEVFGPVLTVIPTDSTEQAIARANHVEYGLTASVYGRNVGAALAVAARMEAGYVWVNDTSTHFPALPFGGVKESGVGREESFDELLSYTQLRATSVRRG